MKSISWLNKSVLLGSTFVLGLFSSNLSFAKEFYKWIDHKGSTHYTTTPPPKSSQSRGKIDTYGYRIPSTSNAQPAAATQHNSSSEVNPSTTASTPGIQNRENQNLDNQQLEANRALEKGAKDRSAPQ